MLDLKVGDVDLKAGEIKVRRRVRMTWTAFRSLRMDESLAMILKRWMRDLKCNWVFPGVKQQNPWKTGFYSSTPFGDLKRACVEAGIAPVTFMQLRRFHSRHAVRVPLIIIPPRVLLGKKSERPIVNGVIQPARNESTA